MRKLPYIRSFLVSKHDLEHLFAAREALEKEETEYVFDGKTYPLTKKKVTLIKSIWIERISFCKIAGVVTIAVLLGKQRDISWWVNFTVLEMIFENMVYFPICVRLFVNAKEEA